MQELENILSNYSDVVIYTVAVMLIFALIKALLTVGRAISDWIKDNRF